MRIQPRVKNRKPISSGVLKEINKRIEQTAFRFNCSKSFVINTMLAEALGIETDEVYYRPKEFSMVLKRNAKVIPINRKRA